MINRVLIYNSGGGIGDALQILPLISALIKGKVCSASPIPPPELYKSIRFIISKIIQIIDLHKFTNK